MTCMRRLESCAYHDSHRTTRSMLTVYQMSAESHRDASLTKSLEKMHQLRPSRTCPFHLFRRERDRRPRRCCMLSVRLERVVGGWEILSSWVSLSSRMPGITADLLDAAASYYCTVLNDRNGCCRNGRIYTLDGDSGCVTPGYVRRRPRESHAVCIVATTSHPTVPFAHSRGLLPHFSGRVD